MLSATLKRKRPGALKDSEQVISDATKVKDVNGDAEASDSDLEEDFTLSGGETDEDEDEDDTFPDFDPASDSEITEADSEYDEDASYDIKVFPEANIVISNITGQPKRTYPEIDPVYDSDSSTEEVSRFSTLFNRVDNFICRILTV